jgi:hypothetical protein
MQGPGAVVLSVHRKAGHAWKHRLRVQVTAQVLRRHPRIGRPLELQLVVLEHWQYLHCRHAQLHQVRDLPRASAHINAGRCCTRHSLTGCCCTASMPASAAGCRELTLSRNPRKVPCLPDPTLLLGCAVKVRSGTSYTISCPAPTWSDIKASRASDFMLHGCIGLSSVSVHDKWSCSVRPRRLHAHLWPLVPLAPVEGLGCEIKGAVELAAQLRIPTVYTV